jgi:hypothetical protein
MPGYRFIIEPFTAVYSEWSDDFENGEYGLGWGLSVSMKIRSKLPKY